MNQTVSLRRARCLLLYWNDERLLFYNFASRITVSAKPIACEVLNFFHNWQTRKDAVTHFGRYSPRSVYLALLQLTKHGLLLEKGSPEATQDGRIAKEWSAWLPEGSFHFSTKDAPYIDRSSWSLARWKAVLPKTPPPQIIKTVKGATKTLPPQGSFPDSEFIQVLMARRTQRHFSSRRPTLETIAQLLSLVWGVKGYFYAPGFGKLLRKTSPSAGARHPGEVYLMALRIKNLSPGLYHYHPSRHRLKTISTGASRDQAWQYCAEQTFVKNAAALFLMTAVFPRTMWKYHRPRAYRAVLLDAGHLCQTFYLVATWLGLAPFCTAALKDTLIEKHLGIDGIRESVLYVAGIGMPATSVRES